MDNIYIYMFKSDFDIFIANFMLLLKNYNISRNNPYIIITNFVYLLN